VNTRCKLVPVLLVLFQSSLCMFIPYSTDAPVYYWPYATVGLIVANVFMFLAMATGGIDNPEAWVLVYGQGLTPIQWLSSIFMHAGPGHLLSNMLFLWVFGLVVEGKLGWWRFLLCFLTIGVLQSAVEQTVMLSSVSDGYSLGASSAIFGILAIAAIWAPKNDVSFFYIIIFYVGSVDIPILGLAVFYIGLDLLGSIFSGLSGSSWLHLGGVIIGVPLGIILLKKGVVDCEGWDIFHVIGGDYGTFKEKPDPEVVETELAELREKHDSKVQHSTSEQIDFFLQHDNSDAALDLVKRMRDMGKELNLSRQTLMKLIAGLQREERWDESCPLMAEVVERFPDKSAAVRVKLAQICVVKLDRPGKALELLSALDLRTLPKDLLELTEKIARRARRLQAEGNVELDTNEW